MREKERRERGKSRPGKKVLEKEHPPLWRLEQRDCSLDLFPDCCKPEDTGLNLLILRQREVRDHLDIQNNFRHQRRSQTVGCFTPEMTFIIWAR